jgi:hypothetical protein
MDKQSALTVMHSPERMFTYSEFAAIMGVSSQTIMVWVKKGSIESPQYLGATARFTGEQINLVKVNGLAEPGTFTVTDSPRAIVGRLGAAAKASLAKRRGRGRGVSPRPRPQKGKAKGKGGKTS